MELLQNKLRPTSLKDVLGQTHIIGKDKVLTNLVKEKKLFNIIFYGSSGCGKTTIALALMNEFNMRYRMLNATVNSKKDFEVVIEEAKMYNGLILIVDEILAVGDFAFQKKCEKRIGDMLNSGTTLLLVSHSTEQVRRICDRAVLINKGKMLIEDDVDTVCDLYTHL